MHSVFTDETRDRQEIHFPTVEGLFKSSYSEDVRCVERQREGV